MDSGTVEKNLLEELRKIKCIESPANFSTNFAAYGVDSLGDRVTAADADRKRNLLKSTEFLHPGSRKMKL